MVGDEAVANGAWWRGAGHLRNDLVFKIGAGTGVREADTSGARPSAARATVSRLRSRPRPSPATGPTATAARSCSPRTGAPHLGERQGAAHRRHRGIGPLEHASTTEHVKATAGRRARLVIALVEVAASRARRPVGAGLSVRRHVTARARSVSGRHFDDGERMIARKTVPRTHRQSGRAQGAAFLVERAIDSLNADAQADRSKCRSRASDHGQAEAAQGSRPRRTRCGPPHVLHAEHSSSPAISRIRPPSSRHRRCKVTNRPARRGFNESLRRGTRRLRLHRFRAPPAGLPRKQAAAPVASEGHCQPPGHAENRTGLRAPSGARRRSAVSPKDQSNE